MGNTFYLDSEVKLMIFLQDHVNEIALTIAKMVTFFGTSTFLVGVVIVFYLGINKEVGFKMGLNAITGSIFNGLVKNIFLRRRPYFDHEEIECYAIVESDYDMYDIQAQGYSFPSGHSSNSVTLPLTLYRSYKDKRILIGTILFAFFIGLSRVVLGCHYPTDVLFGWLQGVTTVLLMDQVSKRYSKRTFHILLCLISSIGILYCNSNDYFTSLGVLYGLVVSNYLDEKYIHFQNTKNIVKIVVRVAISALIFLGLNSLLKVPFSSAFLESKTILSFLFRTFRYFVSCLSAAGFMPMFYRYNILKLNDDRYFF